MSIAEIKSYTKPQLPIQEVMKATLLILGEQEEGLQVRADWVKWGLSEYLLTISHPSRTTHIILPILIPSYLSLHCVVCRISTIPKNPTTLVII